jgi:tRNA pseudouridine55 synthase
MADLLHLVDKPEGWTSHDAVARMRVILGESRLGHAGTLDPFASGLLLMGEGRATGLLGTLGLLPKRYRARAHLGATTDTQDWTGKVTRVSNRIPARPEIEAALAEFRGLIHQRPPLYSAVKVGGERLYQAARRGREVERKAREVRVYDIRLTEWALPEVTIDVTVGRGTYIRALAHDLGEALGCGAHLTALRRLASGPFDVADALSCERGAGHDAAAFRARAVSPEVAVAFLPRLRLGSEEAARLRHGRAPFLEAERLEHPPTPWPLPPGERGWPIALAAPDGSLLALARPIETQDPGSPARLQRVLVGA